uniref:Macro domain-containing protein n=1 Tax=Gopherus evgoodei TaxID=1825980 RepID=A0A8C4Y200_9SAUR
EEFILGSQGMASDWNKGEADTEESLTIPISKEVYEILMRRESCLCDLIEKKFGCMSLLKSIRCPLEVYRKSLKEGIEISVWMDDMTRHNADALVNAANEHLDHIGGLALALVKVGGPEIKQESKCYIDRHGTLTTGQIAVTGGGRLSCKKVIHTVGPRWSANESERCCHMLETAIINVLKYVNAPENNIKSVAIPAVSSGIFGFPLDLCAHVIVRTIKNFVELAPLFGWFKEIHLVNIAEPTVAAVKKACEELLGRSDINSLQEIPPASANCLPDSITINGLCLHIIRGHIEDQQVIIVNSVVMNDDLSRGNLSGAILEKAGVSFQKEFLFELQKLPPYCEKFILTKGYNLACKSVLHIVWSSQSSSDSRKGLKTAMSRCLLKIQEYQLPSISFPAIGTGVLTLPNDEVADIMIDEVLSFAKEHPWKKTDVYFVIHPNDSYAYKVKHLALTIRSRSDRQAEIENKKTGPAIELIGNCYEKLEAAKIWIEDIMQVQESHLIVIENNHIFNLSKREHAELSHLQRFGVSILEEVVGGKARLEIQGPPGAIIDAVFVIENLLCYVQENNRTKQDELPQSEAWICQESCQINLIAFFDRVTSPVDRGEAVGEVYLDFNKTFDTISHDLLINKLGKHNLDGATLKWVGSQSCWKGITDRVLQGSVLGLVLFNIFIIDLDNGIDSTLTKFADDTKLGGVASALEDRIKIQNDPDKLEKWSEVNRMKFNKDKCKVLHLARNNQLYTYKMGNDCLGRSTAERDLGIIVDHKLNMNQQSNTVAKKANIILGCISRSVVSKTREIIFRSTQC